MKKGSGLYFSKMETPEGQWIAIIEQKISDGTKEISDTILIQCATLSDCDAFLSGMHTLIERYKIKSPGQVKIVNDPSLISQ